MATILIIEDNRVIRENTAEFLEMEGFRTITANNGKEGLDKISLSIPDIIVCDILMPEMDGFELLEELGKNPYHKRIPVIFFSAKSEKSEIKKAFDFGVYDYIVKPSDLEDLILSIQQCLQRS